MLSPEDQQRALFQSGDPVSFTYRRATLDGTIIRLNPKRAIVRVQDDDFSIPYARLVSKAEKGPERIQCLEKTVALAEALFKQHGVTDWTFGFDHTARRAGCCDYRSKRISVAFDLAANGNESDIRDTILHEIAHALVGRKHHHDAVWKTKALEIGCSGKRTHRLSFTTPRWSVTCKNRCWTSTAQRRNSKLICRSCGAKLIYSPYTAGNAIQSCPK